MAVVSLGRVVAVFLAAWLVVIVLLGGSAFHSSEPDSEQVFSRLSRALGELEALKMQNEELRALLNSLRLSPDTGENSENAVEGGGSHEAALKLSRDAPIQHKGSWEPSLEFEETRRHVENGLDEFLFFLSSELHKLNRTGTNNAEKVSFLLEDIKNRKRAIHADLKKLKDLDGLKEWREKEAKSLSDLVQKRLHYLQNPSDCSSARKLLCNLNKGCGYGCQVHHAVYCLIVAYGTQRTLILRSHNWRYAQKGWESVFMPISDTCKEDTSGSRVPWPGSDSAQVIELPIIDNVRPRPQYLPLAVPRDLSSRISRLSGSPPAWWVGQFATYLLRPQPHIKEMLDTMEQKMDFKHPVVGVHVRRTDKIGTEAAFHPIEEYMEHVEEYFKQLELESLKPLSEKRVYLATDDPNLLAESKKKFPEYIFYGDPKVAKSASVGQRYSTESLKGVILDIHMLSKCDFLVCTFSSQVCRLAYELMQSMHSDASSYFRSLDDIFYFGGQGDHDQEAILPHNPQSLKNSKEQFAMEAGDVLGIAGNHWDGYSKGINRRTKKSGLYPSYKAKEKLRIVDFPTYPDA